MNIKLLSFTDLKVALEAGLVCTDNCANIDKYDANNFLSKLIKAGHESVIEHIVYSFKIENITRAVLQELARHRHISLSVKSTRWALKKFANDIPYYYPNYPSSEDNIPFESVKTFIRLKELSKELSDTIAKCSVEGIPNDILKYFIQESMCTDLVLSLNARELRHICHVRKSEKALKEFQQLCDAIYEKLPEEHKFMYSEYFN